MEEHIMQKLVAELLSRLCMAPEEFDYEVRVPQPDYYLGVSGSSKNSRFALTPIALDADDSRYQGDPVTFVLLAGGAKSTSEPSIELFDWLRSNPWSRICRPDADD